MLRMEANTLPRIAMGWSPQKKRKRETPRNLAEIRRELKLKCQGLTGAQMEE